MELTLQPESHSSVPLRPLVQGILDKVTLCTMATVNQDGTAHVNTAFFCVDPAWRLFFVSRESTKHISNIKEHSSMAVAVFDSSQAWDDWKIGLQLFGTGALARGRDAFGGANLYKKRFPDYAKWLHGLGRVVGHSSAPPFFMFIPESLKVLHEKELGEETLVTIMLSRDSTTTA